MLCVNWDQGKAWLQLNEFVDPCGHDISEFEKCCADFGIRNCYDIYDFNSLLEELGTEAVQNAALYEEDEDEGADECPDFDLVFYADYCPNYEGEPFSGMGEPQ